MRRAAPKPAKHIERYDLKRSPLALQPSQAELAKLLRSRKPELAAIRAHKEDYIVRRDLEKGGKIRHLTYPVRRLRRIHNSIKYHLSKIRLPDYLYSPRARRAQRDNALLHVGQRQYLTLDIKQFYPSTSRDHVFQWFRSDLGMSSDVAGLLADLLTVDERVSFGSPATPALVALVHREMFDEIEAECNRRGLRISLWVDDIVISGNFVPGELLVFVRAAIRKRGLRSHKIKYRTGARAVVITGIPVVGDKLGAPRSLHEKIREGYEELFASDDDCVYRIVVDRLINALGTYRYIVGRATPAGRRASDRMAILRRHRATVPLVATTKADANLGDLVSNDAGVQVGEAPF